MKKQAKDNPPKYKFLLKITTEKRLHDTQQVIKCHAIMYLTKKTLYSQSAFCT